MNFHRFQFKFLVKHDFGFQVQWNIDINNYETYVVLYYYTASLHFIMYIDTTCTCIHTYIHTYIMLLYIFLFIYNYNNIYTYMYVCIIIIILTNKNVHIYIFKNITICTKYGIIHKIVAVRRSYSYTCSYPLQPRTRTCCARTHTPCMPVLELMLCATRTRVWDHA